MLIPDLANSAYSRIVRGTVQRASQLDYSLLIAEDNTEETASVQRLVRSHLIDGLIVASARPRHPLVPFLLEIGFPHVFALRAVPGSRRNVTIDDERVSMVAYDHLHSLGHVRIGQVAGPKSIDSARRRAAGFRKRAQEYGLPVPAVAHGRFSEQSGAEAARSLLETDPTITGIFTQSLTQGVGALYAIQRMGFSIPEQVSVISYDDMPLAEFLQPSLTTVRVPLEALGVAAFDALSAQLDGQPSEDVVVPTEPTVIVRESTAAAP
jgi:LacI family transcriptional regulator